MKFAPCVMVFNVAVMNDELVAATCLSVTVKVPVVAPAFTVTDATTVAIEVTELLRAMTAPPVPAALFRVTVPVTTTLLPPTTVGADKDTAATTIGFRVKVTT